MDRFNCDTKCREVLESLRWPDGPTCHRCGVIGVPELPVGGIYQVCVMPLPVQRDGWDDHARHPPGRCGSGSLANLPDVCIEEGHQREPDGENAPYWFLPDGFVRVTLRRGSMPGCTFDDPATFGIAFRLTASATPSGLYHRYGLSFQDVEDLLADRGRIVSDDTLRQGCGKVGPEDARRVKRRHGRLGATWCLDAGCVAVNGQRAVAGARGVVA